MKSGKSASGWPLLLTQIWAIIGGLAFLAFTPPAHGRMILIPLTETARASVLPLALKRGALLIASGPLPGSFVVDGDRMPVSTMLGHGVIVLAAPPSGCNALRAGAPS